MIPVLTAAETRELDRATEERGVPVAALMERAGHAVARAAAHLAGGAYGRRAVALCGKGNNGGDALVAARLLAGEGMAVTAVLLADPGDLREPTAGNLRRLDRAGVRRRAYSAEVLARELGRADVAIDGLFGSGFSGEPRPPYDQAIEAVNRSGVPVVAVDLPSGVEGDTGMVRGPAVRADVTVTFGAPKVGDVLPPGAERAGDVRVADIGFPADLVRSDLLLVEEEDVAALLPARQTETHKRRSGVVMVIGGSRRMTGAPRLMASGAARAGAGLVYVAVPEGILPVVQTGSAEWVYVPLPEGPEGAVADGAWETIAERLDEVDAVAVGPGLSTEGGAASVARRAMAESSVPVVGDADALNAFAGRAGELARRRSDAVLTPHAGEFGRLFGMPVGELQEDRVGFVRKAVAETRSVVLLKGHRTLIGLPDGEVRVNPTGTPALATGGTGDVLAGVIAAGLARGLSAADAATVGAYVHGVAGGLAGARRGEGAVAPDVAELVPEAVLSILGGSR